MSNAPTQEDFVLEAAYKLLGHALYDVSKLYGSKGVSKTVAESVAITELIREAAELDGDGGENFDGWMPLSLASANKYYDYTLAQLDLIRNTSRTLCDSNEVAKNVQLHQRNFIVGSGVTIDIYPEDLGSDPVKLASQKEDAQIRKMKQNWKLFDTTNNMTQRLYEWVRRAHRDGEAYLRIFDAKDTPIVRFMEPAFIRSDDTAFPYGIKYSEADVEDVQAVFYKPGQDAAKTVSIEDLIIDKRNVDMIAPRGIPSYWPCLSNFRRLEKILVNSSVLATVQAAITMVRSHDKATAPQISAMLAKNTDGQNRVDSLTGRSIYSRKVRPGTVLDAPKGTTYTFPSHSVNASSFIDIATHELTHIANGFVLPVEWLLTTEPTDSLTDGSPVIANFATEQNILFGHLERLFWNIQGRMGINVERNRQKYAIYINGKRLAVGKALDEARVDEIATRLNVTSPQEIAAKYGRNYTISRANSIRHRATQQPGEVFLGDAGNTNTTTTAAQPAAGQGGDGLSKAGGGQRGADGQGAV